MSVTLNLPTHQMYALRALCHHKHTNKPKTLSIIILRTLISSPKLNPQLQTKPSLLHVFQESVGLLPETTQKHIQTQFPNNEINQKLWDLEREVKDLKQNAVNFYKTEKPISSLSKLFSGKSEKVEKQVVFQDLSDEMRKMVKHFYKEGYFSEANFVKGRELDFCSIDESFGRDFIKFAADKFGKDHQEIAKWLSGAELKNVALFGCPSLEKKTVFSAKRLRKFFHIEEITVCTKCVLKHSCKFANRNVGGETKCLGLPSVMRVIISYDLEEIHPNLTVSDEIKASVKKLLMEVLRLTQTVSPTSNKMD